MSDGMMFLFWMALFVNTGCQVIRVWQANKGNSVLEKIRREQCLTHVQTIHYS